MFGVVGMRDSSDRPLLHVAIDAVVRGLHPRGVVGRQLATAYVVTGETFAAIERGLLLRFGTIMNGVATDAGQAAVARLVALAQFEGRVLPTQRGLEATA